jgi:ABC-type sugar transport system permease subunit
LATTKEKVIVSGRKRGKGIIFTFLFPALLIYILLFVYPAFNTFKYSLYNWSGFGINNAVFIGLGNFKEALTDQYVWLALSNNLYILVIGGFLMFSAALFFSVVLTIPGFRGRSFFKAVIFMPYVLNQAAVGLMWVFILQPRFGLLNTLLRQIGLDSLAQSWLGSRSPAMGSIIFVIIWSSIGFYMILLMAGIETIPSDLYDSAQVDGANTFQLFRFLTLPLIRDILSIAVIFWMLNAIQQFGVIFAMTRGAPANQTNTVATYMMNLAFPYLGSYNFRFGYASAIGVLMLIPVFGISLLLFALRRKEALEF